MKTIYSVIVNDLDVEQLGDVLNAINRLNQHTWTARQQPLVPEVRARVPNHFDVELSAIGTNKIQVIKAIREITGLGLHEAKDMADKAAAEVQIVRRSVPRDDAERAIRILRDAGATAGLR